MQVGDYTVSRWKDRGREHIGETEPWLHLPAGLIISLRDNWNLSDSGIEDGIDILRKVREKKIHSGYGWKESAAAAAFAARRRDGEPVSYLEHAMAFDDIAGASIDKRRLISIVKKIKKETDVNIPRPDYDALVEHIADKANVRHEKAIEDAIRIAEEAVESMITSGRSPYVVAGACFYIGCKKNGIDISQSRVAMAAPCTSPSLRENTYLLIDELDLDVQIQD